MRRRHAAAAHVRSTVSAGHRVIYDREVPFELRVQQVSEVPQEVGTLEAVRVKMLLLGDDASPGVIKMELTSENDLFFHYTHTLDEQGFRLVQEQQKLMVDFAEYPTVRRHPRSPAEPIFCRAFEIQLAAFAPSEPAPWAWCRLSPRDQLGTERWLTKARRGSERLLTLRCPPHTHRL